MREEIYKLKKTWELFQLITLCRHCLDPDKPTRNIERRQFRR